MNVRRQEQQLRKHMLIMRAQIERIELTNEANALREALSMTSLLRATLPLLTLRQGLPLLFGAFRRYPLLGSAISAIGAGMKSSAFGRAVRWAGLALAIWQGYSWVRRATRKAASVPADDLTQAFADSGDGIL
jgi:hypothetical protein